MMKIAFEVITGMKPSALRDCSTYKFQFTSFLKFESHNKQKAEDKRGKAVGAMMTVIKTRTRAVLPGGVTGSASRQRDRNRMAGYGTNNSRGHHSVMVVCDA